MTKEKDMRPAVGMEDLDRAWYEQLPDGWVLKLRFRKLGESGVMKFGLFDTKAEAKEFLVQLKKAVV